MVKGNNTVKNNKSVSFQPYDVSNSFVKKVTSRVSEFLHQPAWIGKWLSTPTEGEIDYMTGNNASSSSNSVNYDLQSSAASEDDTLSEQPPLKRPRIIFNKQYPKLHKFSSPEPGTSLGQAVSPIANHNNVIENDISMPGPSSRMSFVSSTPTVNNCVGNAVPTATKINVNGDDNCSESSESTSGCSSLVPQDNQFKKGGTNISVTGETSSLSRPTIQHSRMNSNTLAAQRPSFNASSFLASSKMGVSPNTSPFYSGRTMYGGASHYRRCAEMGGLFSPTHHSSSLAIRPSVSPCQTTTTTGMSSTARRILDALEQFSTPVLDAKRIPLKRSPPKTEEKVRPNKRKMAELSSSIPTTPDLLRLKRKERLQDSTTAARHLSSSFSKSMGTPQSAYSANEYSIREDDEEGNDKYKGKIKTKRKDRDKDITSEPKENVTLPNTPLGITSLPKIDIALPPKPSFSSQTIDPSSSPTISVFKFSKPSFDTFKKLSHSKSVLPEVSPKPVQKSDEVSQNTNTVSMNFTYTPTSTIPKEKSTFIDKSSQTVVENDASASLSLLDKKTETKPDVVKTSLAPTFSDFGDKFKKPEGSWECNSCLIQNKPEATKCIACETCKPSSSTSSNSSAATPASSSLSNVSGFDNNFKKSESSLKTDSNLLNFGGIPKQPASSLAPTTTATTNLISATTGFGDKFKKPEGAWECGVCMVQNKSDQTKCVACETAKPGSSSSSSTGLKSSVFSAPSSSSEPKFNFGVDKANEPKFTFGVTKANTEDKQPASAPSVGFKFDANESKPAAGSPSFSFGLSPPTKAQPSAVQAPSFNFGAPAATEAKKAADGTSSNTTSSSQIDSPKSSFTFNSGSVFKPASGGFSFGTTNEKPKEPLFNAVEKPKENMFNSNEKPKDTADGVEKPKENLFGSVGNKTNQNLFGSVEKPKENIFGSTNTKPNQMLFGAAEKPKDSVFGMTNDKPNQAVFGATDKPKENLFGGVESKKEGLFSEVEKPKENLFGKTSENQNQSIFSGGDKSAGNIFGASNDKTNQSVFGGVEKPKENIFGAPSEKPKENSLFGATAKPAENLFGTQNDKPAAPLFGVSDNKTEVGSPQLGSSFGSTGGFSFGNPSSVSQANTFSFGAVKPNPPTTTAPSFPVNANSNPNSSVFTFGAAEAGPAQASPFGSASTNSFASPFQPTVTTTAAELKPIFSFGGVNATSAPTPTPAPAPAPVSGGFSFSAPAVNVNKSQGFSFSAPQTDNTASTGGFSFGGAPTPAAPKQPSVFMFKSENTAANNMFGSPPASTASPFGVPSSAAPSFGAPTGAPNFNFGASNSAPAPQAVFTFGNQDTSATPVFGGQQPTSSVPSFNPNIPKNFHFTGGATPQFSATPSAGAGAVSGRRFKKAVRRTTQR